MASETVQMHCTTCPNDCALKVEVEQTKNGPQLVNVSGNRCPRGATFARQEITRPMRVLATTVVVRGGDEVLLPVRTAEAIPRDLHLQAMKLINATAVDAPIKMGDTIIENILDTGVNVIASMDIDTL